MLKSDGLNLLEGRLQIRIFPYVNMKIFVEVFPCNISARNLSETERKTHDGYKNGADARPSLC
jgi:hypothetical protein